MIMENNTFLSLKSVEKVYPNGEKAVYDFNLDVNKNDFIVIVGPSGCGKSTTLRMIAGLEDVTSGDIFMENELINYKESKDRKMAIVFQSYALYPQMNVYDNIAFPLTINKYPFPIKNEVLTAVSEIERVIASCSADAIAQAIIDANKHKKNNEELSSVLNISLYAGSWLNSDYAHSKLTEGQLQADAKGFLEQFMVGVRAKRDEELVRVENSGVKLDEEYCELDENGERKIVYRKMTDYEIRVKVFETAQTLDLTPYLDKIPKELSGGQMQRVALGRAIVKNVPVFMMDEPLSNLDAKLRLTMRSEIVKLHNKINATTIYVTHDQTEAMTMATRIVVMSRGFIQQIGTPDEIYNDPCNVFVAKFIGSPSMNFFDMKYDRENNVLYNDAITIPTDQAFKDRYDAFYQTKQEAFEKLLGNFDKSAHESVLKILSATESGKDYRKKEVQKTSFIVKVKKLFVKENNVDPYELTRSIATKKLEDIHSFREGNRNLCVGIRPERISIQKYDPAKSYDNAVILTPTVCELLGAEYNIHFDYCGKDMVGKIDAKGKITLHDKIAVSLQFDDIYIFDPVSGDVI